MVTLFLAVLPSTFNPTGSGASAVGCDGAKAEAGAGASRPLERHRSDTRKCSACRWSAIILPAEPRNPCHDAALFGNEVASSR